MPLYSPICTIIEYNRINQCSNLFRMWKEIEMFCIFYEVKQGDTLYSISRRNNVDLNAIMMANPFINVYNLQIGDVICLPCVSHNSFAHFTTYLVANGDTLGSVAAKNHINLADLLEINDIDTISLMPGTTLSVPIQGEGEGGIVL